jgi:ElaB/YqjD/DUF883 family membrane-anchored ribosome-binding protein
MATSQNDLDDLKRLQEETEELRKGREERPSATASVTEQPTAEVDRKPEDDKDDARSLAIPIENIVGELEEIVRERPALALLAAFGIGMVVGKLLERR